MKQTDPTTQSLAPLIVIEGVDGTGKTTIIKEIASRLGFEATRAPGGTLFAERLRHSCLNDDVSPLTQLLLYSSLVNDGMEANLKLRQEGKTVISDRGFGSTFAYQGLPYGNEGVLKNILDTLPGSYTPNLTLYLTVDPEIAYEREGAGGRSQDRYSKFDTVTKEKIREAYDKLYGARMLTNHIEINDQSSIDIWYLRSLISDAIEIIDANQSIEAVVDSCIAAIKKHLP